MSKEILIALAGNPNSGKTAIFNAITGANQRVGNYPGVTVERKEGYRLYRDYRLTLVDLPGIYSLTAHSEDEIVARNALLQQRPDVVVNIVDASNLERNLYLALQLQELGAPLVLVLNMCDRLKARGHQVDLELLSQELRCPVVATVGHRKEGIEELLEAIVKQSSHGAQGWQPHEIGYGPEIEQQVQILEKLITREDGGLNGFPSRWVAIKLLENDEVVHQLVGRQADRAEEILSRVRLSSAQIQHWLGHSSEVSIAKRRYDLIGEICSTTIRYTETHRPSWSDRLDAILLHRGLSIPIFLVLMFLVFQLTFALGDPLVGLMEAGIGALVDGIGRVFPGQSALKSLVVDGIIGGVGGVMVFLPNIFLLFLCLSILEDSGYMARAAFLVDRVMHKIGLQGKSFIPMLVGFGCSVPGIMATRTLESSRDRLTTMLVLPLMSCGARLPIYALLIPAFFPPAWQGPMLWLIYVIGVGLAIGLAKVLRLTVFRGKASPFVMELPPYHWPMFSGLLLHAWQRAWLYLKKAGTIIVGISVLMWALTSYPRKEVFEAEDAGARQSEALSYAVAGRLGHAMEPLLEPMGFDWRIGTALIGAFAAKEVFVAQMGIVYSLGEVDEGSQSLRQTLSGQYTPLVAFCIMLFCLIGMPCMATVAVMRKESGSWKWPLLQFGGLTALAFVLTTLVYQIGSLIL